MLQKQRKLIIGCNWKSNYTLEEVTNFIIENLNKIVFDSQKIDLLIAPTFLHIPVVQKLVSKNIQLCAQNCNNQTFGAYTGEISPDHLIDLEIKWVILGHSERRSYFGETNEIVGQKVALALKKGLNVIACIGETLAQRETNQTFNVCKSQLDAIYDKIIENKLSWDNLIISYEPLWAIGTGYLSLLNNIKLIFKGKTADYEQVEEMQAYIREYLIEFIGEEVGGKTKILYGGSVNEASSKELIKLKNVDGFLIGTAAMSKSVEEIVKNCSL